jgi:hypothetical protein
VANATKDRATDFFPSALNQTMVEAKLVADYIAYAGTMQTRDANGRLKNPGATAERVTGVVIEHKDATGKATDVISANLRRGAHKFALHGVNPPTAADIGKLGYASDNVTISKTAADGSLAGEIIAVETDGVFVDIGKAVLA